METRQIHVKDLSTVTGVMQYEHEVQSIYFLGLEDFEGDIYLSIESDQYSNEAVPLNNNTFVVGQPMTLYNVTYTCQIYGVLNDGEKIQLSKRFRLIIDKSNDIQGDSSEYPIDPNFENSIIEFVNEQKTELDTYTESQKSEIQSTGEAVIASIPSDYTTLEQATYNAYPTQSETGNPIYFDDGAKDIPVKELIVNLEPKQSGTGDPSPTNVRPISGFDGITVKRTGKNLLKPVQVAGTVNGITRVNNADGSTTLTGTATARADIQWAIMPNIVSGVNYVFSVNKPSDINNGASFAYMTIKRANDTLRYVGIGGSGALSTVVTFDDGEELRNTFLRVENGKTVNEIICPMLRLASASDSTFEPYTEQEYSITFPSSVGTVYGGSLNVTTGELVVDRTFRSTTWGALDDLTTVGTVERRRLRIGANMLSPSAESASNIAPYISGGFSTDKGVRWYNDATSAFFYLPSSTASTTAIEAVIKLATPTTVQLTPTEVSTLLGSNTIQSDGSINLTYRADTTKVIEKLTNAIVSLGGNV